MAWRKNTKEIKNKLRCYTQQLESCCVFTIKSAYATSYAIKIYKDQVHMAYAMKKKNIGTLWDFTKHLHQKPYYRTSQGLCTGTLQNLTTQPSGTSSGSGTGNFRNLTRYLHQNPLEPNFRNLTRYQHQNPPEPCPEPGVAVAPDRTGADLG